MPRRTFSKITIDNDLAYVELTQGFTAVIDRDDIGKISPFVWCLAKNRRNKYAQTSLIVNGSRKVMQMHRLLLECPDGLHIDHIDRNGLNNRKQNLRVVSVSENIRNSRLYETNKSGLMGVSWYKPLKKWRAQIRENGEKRHLGYYECKNEASTAYQNAKLKTERLNHV